jgi:hypothetical protein
LFGKAERCLPRKLRLLLKSRLKNSKTRKITWYKYGIRNPQKRQRLQVDPIVIIYYDKNCVCKDALS